MRLTRLNARRLVGFLDEEQLVERGKCPFNRRGTDRLAPGQDTTDDPILGGRARPKRFERLHRLRMVLGDRPDVDMPFWRFDRDDAMMGAHLAGIALESAADGPRERVAFHPKTLIKTAT